MEVTIFSPYANRPDFIKPQYESIKKHVKDPCRFIVINNSYFVGSKPHEIETITQEEGIPCVRIRHKDGKGEYSEVMRDSLNFWWHQIKDMKGIVAILDCDLFFIGDVSFIDLMKGYDMAFCPTYTAGKVWPWTGLMIFNMDTIKVDDISFDFESLDRKTYQDVGSALYNYIEKHDPKTKLLNRKEILDTDWPIKGKETLYTLGFPQPYSVDVISTDVPFMFHYKTSSNYAPHCTPEYNEAKTEALMKIL